MLITYQDKTIAELLAPPSAIDFFTLFGQPCIQVKGLDITQLKVNEGVEIDENGIRNLNIKETEDVFGILLFPEGKPKHE